MLVLIQSVDTIFSTTEQKLFTEKLNFVLFRSNGSLPGLSVRQ